MENVLTVFVDMQSQSATKARGRHCQHAPESSSAIPAHANAEDASSGAEVILSRTASARHTAPFQTVCWEQGAADARRRSVSHTLSVHAIPMEPVFSTPGDVSAASCEQ